MKRILGLFILLLLLGCSQEEIEKPSGIFLSSGAYSDEILNNPEPRGILIRVSWEDIEPEPGKFNFSKIEEERKKIISSGKKWSLAVRGFPPNWLEVETFKVVGKTGKKEYREKDLPKYWDSTLQQRLKILAEALGKKYNSDNNLALVYVTQMTANGIEGHFNRNSNEVLIKAGLTKERWVEAAKSASKSYATAFPDKVIAIEVHEILDDASIPEKIINDLWNDPELNHRVGAAMWWLSGKETYQQELIEVLREYPGDIYAQVIDRSDNLKSFKDENYATVFTQAEELGIQYIEVWEYELNGDYMNEIRKFNNIYE